MAVRTFRLSTTVVASQQDIPETDQTAATTAAGWTVAKTALGNSAAFIPNQKVLATSFTSQTTTPKPGVPAPNSGFAAFTTDILRGQFAATAWTLTFALRSVAAAATGTVRVRVRVFRVLNSDGSSATELTGSTQVGTTTAALSTTVDQLSTVTWTPAAPLVFTSEYLFITVSLEIMTASGSNSADALLRTGQAAGGTRIVTSDFSTGATYTKGGFGKENG